MPLGSSSAAPVTSPGPKSPAASFRLSLSSAMLLHLRSFLEWVATTAVVAQQSSGRQCQLLLPLKPCATTYHSLESLRLAGGLACLTVAKLRLSSATRLLSAPPARTFAT